MSKKKVVLVVVSLAIIFIASCYAWDTLLVPMVAKKIFSLPIVEQKKVLVAGIVLIGTLALPFTVLMLTTAKRKRR